jgi:hypothetical protein
MILENEFTPLSESSVNHNGIMRIRIIAPGQGSSGYYSAKLLEKAAPLYKSGTHMYINHPSKSELKERPERDLNNLAGYLTTDGRYEANGAYGPGIYSECKILPRHWDFIKEAAPVIGISHMAEGRTTYGEIDGQRCTIVESIDKVLSVDIVTQPGARGAFITEGKGQAPSVDDSTLKLYESYRQNMSDAAARQVIHAMTGDVVPDVSNIPTRFSEVDEMLIRSYQESGMRRETAEKIVMGMTNGNY